MLGRARAGADDDDRSSARAVAVWAMLLILPLALGVVGLSAQRDVRWLDAGPWPLAAQIPGSTATWRGLPLYPLPTGGGAWRTLLDTLVHVHPALALVAAALVAAGQVGALSAGLCAQAVRPRVALGLALTAAVWWSPWWFPGADLWQPVILSAHLWLFAPGRSTRQGARGAGLGLLVGLAWVGLTQAPLLGLGLELLYTTVAVSRTMRRPTDPLPWPPLIGVMVGLLAGPGGLAALIGSIVSTDGQSQSSLWVPWLQDDGSWVAGPALLLLLVSGVQRGRSRGVALLLSVLGGALLVAGPLVKPAAIVLLLTGLGPSVDATLRVRWRLLRRRVRAGRGRQGPTSRFDLRTPGWPSRSDTWRPLGLSVLVGLTGLAAAPLRTPLPRRAPWETASWVLAHPLQPPAGISGAPAMGTGLFTSPSVGVLYHRLGGDRRTGLDGRVAGLTDTQSAVVTAVLGGAPRAGHWLEAAGVRRVALVRGEPLEALLREQPGWILAHCDASGVVFDRVPTEGLAAARPAACGAPPPPHHLWEPLGLWRLWPGLRAGWVTGT